jgi:SprT protein
LYKKEDLHISNITGSVPPTAIPYCLDLHATYDFDFYISRPRKTRLGDFTYRQGTRPVITVNQNLNPYAFLITYLHEVAHCAVYRKYRKRVAPHGAEWKQAFREILIPVLTEEFFPADVLVALRAYAVNPKATTSGDIRLSEALKQHDLNRVEDNKKPLKYLQEGSLFVFNGRGFIKGAIRRTRVLCVETISKKKYTIAAHALVEEQK